MARIATFGICSPAPLPSRPACHDDRLGALLLYGPEDAAADGHACMSVPGPWLLDMATTMVAAGKIFKAFINEKPEIPAGWAFDSRGVPAGRLPASTPAVKRAP